MLTGPHTYQLTIKGNTYKADFTRPATHPNLSKLYAISKEQKLFYVGITNTRMSARLSLGMRAKVKSARGFHGYKLKDGTYRLDVWIGKLSRHDLESIEAEVAYYWRERSEQWPEAQNEIHFHATEKAHRETAMRIVATVARGSGENPIG